MATAIYVTSTERLSGKTAFCIGLMRRLGRMGLNAAYMKPISTTFRTIDKQMMDEDVPFIKSILDLPDPLETMAPIVLTEREVKDIGENGDVRKFEARVLDAFGSVSKGRDAVVIEGTTNLREGWMVDLAPPRLSRLLAARSVVIVPFSSSIQVIDDLLAAQNWLGNSLAGGIINFAPQGHLAFLQERAKPLLESRRIPVFAILPKERALSSVSVRELVEGLEGESLCCQNAVDELVEHLMVGAMSAESALTHFRREPNKAVITGGDRPDIQIAALETSTRCLILTGNLRPSPLIIGLAEERGVPIILTRHDTLQAIDIIEKFFGKNRFHQQKKVDHFEKLLNKYMDYEALSKAFGINTH